MMKNKFTTEHTNEEASNEFSKQNLNTADIPDAELEDIAGGRWKYPPGDERNVFYNQPATGSGSSGR